MELLVTFAIKSLLIAGVTLGLLQLMRGRSASERSMVAHLGLLALLLCPLGSMFLPQIVLQAPAFDTAEPAAPVASPSEAVVAGVNSPAVEAAAGFDPLTLWPLFYGFPAALLLAMTLLAVLRLLALRAKASVLVEPSWLSALAHAQRRMNFKHGTALLTSSDLRSPISWGLLRPVILLNDEALEARHEAEAIIAHELAHVRGLDWAKLLLARIVTAIFWFNPLVWMLSREAHQLREETADDAVLAADVASTDYAQLLVGVARHDQKGLLLGAHGVAPGKGSLSRRVRRVLDSTLPRTPVARGFGTGLFLGVVAAAAPLAAVTFAPAAPADPAEPYYVSPPRPTASLPSVVVESVAGATALTGEVVTAHVAAALTGKPAVTPALERELERRIETRIAYAHPHPDDDRAERARAAAERDMEDAVEQAVARKALGVTPDYAARIRSAAPGMRLDEGDLIALKATGVTPEWLADMRRAGYVLRDAGDLAGARAVGVNPTFVAELRALGYRGIPLDELTAMRALGVSGAYIRRLQSRGYSGLSVDKLIELRAHGISVQALRTGKPPGVPHWTGPRPPGVPAPPMPPKPVLEPDEDPEPDLDDDSGE